MNEIEYFMNCAYETAKSEYFTQNPEEKVEYEILKDKRMPSEFMLEDGNELVTAAEFIEQLVRKDLDFTTLNFVLRKGVALGPFIDRCPNEQLRQLLKAGLQHKDGCVSAEELQNIILSLTSDDISKIQNTLEALVVASSVESTKAVQNCPSLLPDGAAAYAAAVGSFIRNGRQILPELKMFDRSYQPKERNTSQIYGITSG